MSMKELLELSKTPNVRNFLDMIAYAEGTRTHGYNTAFGGGRIEDLSGHPKKVSAFTQTDGKKNTTTAAGRYQFLQGTWDSLAKKLGLNDFGADSQDAAAVQLLKESGALKHVLTGEYSKAISAAAPTWASLPNVATKAKYKQNQRSQSELLSILGVEPENPYAKIAVNSLDANQSSAPLTVAQKLAQYNAGKMPPDQAAIFEQSIKDGKLVLPDSMMPKKLLVAQKQAFAAEKKAEAVRLAEVAKTATEQAPAQAGYLDNLGQSFSNLGTTMANQGLVPSFLTPDDPRVREKLGMKQGGAIGDAAGGLAETLATWPLQLGAMSLGGLQGIAQIAASPFTGQTQQQIAADTQRAVERNTSFVLPQDNTGKAVGQVLGTAMQPVIDATVWAGEQTADATGSPLLGAAVTGASQTALNLFGTGRGRKAVVADARQKQAAKKQNAAALKAEGAAFRAANNFDQYATKRWGENWWDVAPPEVLAKHQQLNDKAYKLWDARNPPEPITPDAPPVPRDTQPNDTQPNDDVLVDDFLDEFGAADSAAPAAKPEPPPPPSSNANQPPSGGFLLHDASTAKLDDTVKTVGAGGLDLLHGSTKDGLTAADIQVFNPNATQNRKGRKNGGFYATADATVADKYANMPRRDGAPITPTVYGVKLKEGAKVLEKSGDITRLGEAFINEQRANGVDVVFGKDARGQSEYAIINPDAVVSMAKKEPPKPNAAGKIELTAENPSITLQPSGAKPKSRSGVARTTDNQPINFEYDVVPMSSLTKSVNADLTQNAGVNPDFQPRNRNTDASAQQINTISNKLDPAQLLESPTFSTGAVTVFGNEVVAGHGRSAAIDRRYQSGRGKEYEDAVRAKAAELGIDTKGIDQPVLVRRIADETAAKKVAKNSNADTTLRKSAAEVAKDDAALLPDASLLKINEDGTTNVAGSVDFVRGFMRNFTPAEQGALQTSDGILSQEGLRRVQAALSHKAYGDDTLMSRFMTNLGEQGQRISAALQKNAGALVDLADSVKRGDRYENTLAADLAQAANKYADVRATGSTIRDYLDQGQLVDDGLSAGAREALEVMGENAKSGKAIGEYIQEKVSEIEAKGSPNQESLFQTAKEKKEAEAVRRQYEGTPQWMQAPNGKPTKLSERQWIQTRTPSFKEWFGDWEGNPKGASKVVDENGEPLVVYHETSAANADSIGVTGFDINKLGARASDTLMPDGFFLKPTKDSIGLSDGADARQMPLFVSAKNPASFKDRAEMQAYLSENAEFSSLSKQFDDADQRLSDAYDSAEALAEANGTSRTEAFFDSMNVLLKDGRAELNAIAAKLRESSKKALTNRGSDGLIVESDRGSFGRSVKTIIAFDPTQIKSATGNSGAFNPADPVIYNQSTKKAIEQKTETALIGAGKSKPYAKAAGALIGAYYAATAKVLGKEVADLYAELPIIIKSGDLPEGVNAALEISPAEHRMILGENANSSSFVHESGHHFLEMHAKLADQSPALADELAAVMAWGGQKGRKWSDLSRSERTELHEKFAETFEQYVMTGKAPTKGLKETFKKFADWMLDVYSSMAEFMRGNPRAKLAPDIVAVMDAMLGNRSPEVQAIIADAAILSAAGSVPPILLNSKRSEPVAGGVSPDLYAARYAVLREIGLDADSVRAGTITGDSTRLGADRMLAKSESDWGIDMAKQFDRERALLNEYADKIIDETGGTPLETPETRGATIMQPLEALKNWHKKQIKAAYTSAGEAAEMMGGIDLFNFEKLLDDPATFKGSDGLSVQADVKNVLRSRNMLNDAGQIKKLSAADAEVLRQAINESYDVMKPKTIMAVQSLIKQLDDDVFSTLDADVFKEARAANTAYNRLMVDPKGIGKLLDIDGINRAVSLERVTDALLSLAKNDAAQFRHIADMLEDMPTPELQALADRALGEIRAALAEKITMADTTTKASAAAVDKLYTPFKGGKAVEIFGEALAKKLDNYVAAVGILRVVDPNPSGTSSATRNFMMKSSGAIGGVAGAGAGSIAGPIGSAIGSAAGYAAGQAIKKRILRAEDKVEFEKAFSKEQLNTMRQSNAAAQRRLDQSQEMQDVNNLPDDAPPSRRKSVFARLGRSAAWLNVAKRLSDDDKAAIKKVGLATWFASINQARDEDE